MPFMNSVCVTKYLNRRSTTRAFGFVASRPMARVFLSSLHATGSQLTLLDHWQSRGLSYYYGVVIFFIVGVSSSIIEVRRLWAICELHFLLSYTHSQGIRELASIIHYDIGDLVYVEATTSRHREL